MCRHPLVQSRLAITNSAAELVEWRPVPLATANFEVLARATQIASGFDGRKIFGLRIGNAVHDSDLSVVSEPDLRLNAHGD